MDGNGEMKKPHVSMGLVIVSGAQKNIGHASATPASVAPDALRVLSQNTQVFCFLGAKKIDRLRDLLFIVGAQKRTRTSTPCGTRT